MSYSGTARFPSVQSWLYTEIKGWFLADKLDETQFKRLLKEAKEALAPFTIGEGTVYFRAPAHIITWAKP